VTEVDRRNFLRLRIDGTPTLDVDCERLYQNYVDSEVLGDVDSFVDGLAHRLREVRSVRLYRPFWISCTRLHPRVSSVLEQFRSRGGTVEYR
jgi:hypothetical protein